MDFYREANIERWNEIGFKEIIYNSDVIMMPFFRSQDMENWGLEWDQLYCLLIQHY